MLPNGSGKVAYAPAGGGPGRNSSSLGSQCESLKALSPRYRWSSVPCLGAAYSARARTWSGCSGSSWYSRKAGVRAATATSSRGMGYLLSKGRSGSGQGTRPSLALHPRDDDPLDVVPLRDEEEHDAGREHDQRRGHEQRPLDPVLGLEVAQPHRQREVLG